MTSIYKIFPPLLIIALFIGMISNIIVASSLPLSGFVFVLALIIWGIFTHFKPRLNELSKNTIVKLLILGIIIIFVVQLLVFKFLPVTVYHDPFRALSQAEILSSNHSNWNSSTYFWRYPNNVVLTYLLSCWLRFTQLFGISTNVSIHILSISLIDFFIIIFLKSWYKFSKDNSSTLLLLSFFLMSPFAYTYYLQVFYSDLPSMTIILLIFLIFKSWSNYSQSIKILSTIGLVILTLLGQLIKPNLIVLAVAIFITSFLYFFINRNSLNKVKIPLIAILLGFLLVAPVKSSIYQAANFIPNDKYEFPVTHWIWMGLNPETGGTYNGHDAKKVAQLSDKTSRENYLKKAIPRRIKKLGALGMLQHLIAKTANLLNVGSLQHAYSGGFISAPDAYQKVQLQLSILGSIIIRAYFVVFYFFTLIKLLKTDYSRISILEMLAVITAVGYLAFHILLWEVESRYGQIILPLLLIINLNTDLQELPRLNIKKVLLIAFSIGIVTMGIYNEHPYEHPIITSAQRSQLSPQYSGSLSPIEPNSTISQVIYLNHDSSLFSISIPHNTDLNVFLINKKSQKSYPLRKKHNSYIIKAKLTAGEYKVTLVNTRNYSQLVNLTSTHDYQLSPHPLFINGYKYRYSSLIYKFVAFEQGF